MTSLACNCIACRQAKRREHHSPGCSCALCRVRARVRQFLSEIELATDATARKRLEDQYIRDQLNNIAELAQELSSHERRPTRVNETALPADQRADYSEALKWRAQSFRGGTLVDDDGHMLVKRLRSGGIAFGHPHTNSYDVFHCRPDERPDPIGAVFFAVAERALSKNPIMVTPCWPWHEREFKCQRS